MVGLICSAFPIEIECLKYFFLCSRLIDTDITHIAQQGKVDDARYVFLVVGHQLVQGGIVVAGDGHLAVVCFDELHRLVHLISGEACLHGTEIELTDQSVSYSIAV